MSNLIWENLFLIADDEPTKQHLQPGTQHIWYVFRSENIDRLAMRNTGQRCQLWIFFFPDYLNREEIISLGLYQSEP